MKTMTKFYDHCHSMTVYKLLVDPEDLRSLPYGLHIVNGYRNHTDKGGTDLSSMTGWSNVWWISKLLVESTVRGRAV